MATISKTITINAAFLQEIKEDNQDLRRLLQHTLDLLAVPHGHVRSKQLADALCELRDQFALHFALEEAYGYFEDAISVSSRVSRETESLRMEHRELFIELCELEEKAERLLYHEAPHKVVHEIAHGFRAFCDQFLEHECRENDMILQSFAEDLGEDD